MKTLYTSGKSRAADHVTVGSSRGNNLQLQGQQVNYLWYCHSYHPQWQGSIPAAAVFRCSGRGQEPVIRQTEYSILPTRAEDTIILLPSSAALVRRVIAKVLQNAHQGKPSPQYRHPCMLLASFHKAPNPLRREHPRPQQDTPLPKAARC